MGLAARPLFTELGFSWLTVPVISVKDLTWDLRKPSLLLKTFFCSKIVSQTQETPFLWKRRSRQMDELAGCRSPGSFG